MSPRYSTKRNSSTRGGAVCPQPRRQRNTAAFKRFHDAANAGDANPRADHRRIRLAGCADSHPLPIDATGAEKLKQVWSVLFSVYPDIHLTVDDLIAAGDKIVARNTVTGTHRGDSWAPRHRKSVTYNEIFIFRFVDGRVAETWGVVDVWRRCGKSGWSALEELADRPRRCLRLIEHDQHLGVVDVTSVPPVNAASLCMCDRHHAVVAPQHQHVPVEVGKPVGGADQIGLSNLVRAYFTDRDGSARRPDPGPSTPRQCPAERAFAPSCRTRTTAVAASRSAAAHGQ